MSWRACSRQGTRATAPWSSRRSRSPPSPHYHRRLLGLHCRRRRRDPNIMVSMTARLERLGRKKAIMRCDDENSMLEVLRAIQQRGSLLAILQTKSNNFAPQNRHGEEVQGQIAGIVRKMRHAPE